LLITKNGKPVAELHPVRGGRAPLPWGIGAGGRISGDILAPVLDDGDWEALQP
jgi:antitoxin (DNA-binding transcriptional repressor) of toxin-antitoxin stability system